MRRPFPWLTTGLLTLVVFVAYLRVRPRPSLRTPAPFMAAEPRFMLWAWETPEDLRALDPTRAGVAYLSRELLLGSHREVRPRHQPLLLPPGVFLTAVVRVELSPQFVWRNTDIPAIAEQITAAVQPLRTRALQVDLDARVSEHPFYAALLREVRRQLPPDIALSVTALTSWCGHDSWLHGLPVDEAVPMFFRMGGPAAIRASSPRSFAGIQEGLCTGSAGVATDENWPPTDDRQRIYVFHPGSWRAEDLASVNAGRYVDLQRPPARQGAVP